MPVLEKLNCEAYFRGEIRPIIFEVYSEADIPFLLPEEYGLQGLMRLPLQLEKPTAVCILKDEEGIQIDQFSCKLIATEDTKKTILTTWNTAGYDLGFYRLQVWCGINISGAVDNDGQLIVEAKLASEDILRNIKEA